MGDLPEVISAVAGLIGVAGAIGATWAVARVGSMRSTLDLLTTGNQGLRDSLDDATAHAEKRESVHAVEMKEQEEKCRSQLEAQGEKIAHLSGQVHALTSGIITALVSELRTELVNAVHEAINDPDRRTASG